MEMPDDVAERIVDAHWNKGGDGIKFTNIHQFNACNHRLAGTIDIEGQTFGFVVHSGDWNGFQVEEYGPEDDVAIYNYTPPEPTKFMFVPTNDNLEEDRPAMYKVYLIWKTQEWFKKKLAEYHYDRHFQPGGFIENHYRDWAATKGLKISVDRQ